MLVLVRTQQSPPERHHPALGQLAEQAEGGVGKNEAPSVRAASCLGLVMFVFLMVSQKKKKKVDGKTNTHKKKHPWAEAIFSAQAETTSWGSVLIQ